jgi:hypothetical protein
MQSIVEVEKSYGVGMYEAHIYRRSRNENNRFSGRFYGTPFQISRVMPALRVVAKKTTGIRNLKMYIRDLERSFVAWKALTQ